MQIPAYQQLRASIPATIKSPAAVPLAASSIKASTLRAPFGIERNRFMLMGAAPAIARTISKARPGANEPPILLGRIGAKPRNWGERSRERG